MIMEKPGKSWKTEIKIPGLKKSWNFNKSGKNHGKIMEFYKNYGKSWNFKWDIIKNKFIFLNGQISHNLEEMTKNCEYFGVSDTGIFRCARLVLQLNNFRLFCSGSSPTRVTITWFCHRRIKIIMEFRCNTSGKSWKNHGISYLISCGNPVLTNNTNILNMEHDNYEDPNGLIVVWGIEMKQDETRY